MCVPAHLKLFGSQRQSNASKKKRKCAPEKMKEKFENTKMENESKAKEKLKKKEKRTATHRELLKLNIKCQRQAKQRCAVLRRQGQRQRPRTKAQKSCHMQRSSAKMAATWLTSCKRAKGIREGNQRGAEG